MTLHLPRLLLSMNTYMKKKKYNLKKKVTLLANFRITAVKGTFMNVCGNGLAMSAFTEKDGRPVI